MASLHCLSLDAYHEPCSDLLLLLLVDAHMPAVCVPDVRLARKGVPASLAARHTHPVVPAKKMHVRGERMSGAPFPCRDALLLRGPFFFLSAVVRGQSGRMHHAVAVAVTACSGAVYITPVSVAGSFPVCEMGEASLLSVCLPPMRQEAADTTSHRPAGSPATAPSLVPSPVPDGGLDWTAVVRPASGPVTLLPSPPPSHEPTDRGPRVRAQVKYGSVPRLGRDPGLGRWGGGGGWDGAYFTRDGETGSRRRTRQVGSGATAERGRSPDLVTPPLTPPAARRATVPEGAWLRASDPGSYPCLHLRPPGKKGWDEERCGVNLFFCASSRGQRMPRVNRFPPFSLVGVPLSC